MTRRRIFAALLAAVAGLAACGLEVSIPHADADNPAPCECVDAGIPPLPPRFELLDEVPCEGGAATLGLDPIDGGLVARDVRGWGIMTGPAGPAIGNGKRPVPLVVTGYLDSVAIADCAGDVSAVQFYALPAIQP